MISMDALFRRFGALIAARPTSNPWRTGKGGKRRYAPDYQLLSELVAIPIRDSSGAESGRLAKAVDIWVASELRRAGFESDEVWPRASEPRVLPHDISLYLKSLPPKERGDAELRVRRNKRIAPADARVLGRAYVKQVDVLIAQWSRGPELLVSTKTMGRRFVRTWAIGSRRRTATRRTSGVAIRW